MPTCELLAMLRLSAWAVIDPALAVMRVRRTRRRQSGTTVAEARDHAANQAVR